VEFCKELEDSEHPHLAPTNLNTRRHVLGRLDRVIRVIQQEDAALVDIASMYTDLSEHIELLLATPFVTAPALPANAPHDNIRANAREAYDAQMALFKWCFDPREESVTMAPPPFMRSREHGNPYRLLVQRDPSLLNQPAHKNAEVLLV